ncbi:RagB/SusD family nutrient uptake outer membrane protein [Croceivirga sp. JEA036]|uniref:RagB/SusD family nutrient uptake outer membrane protein n=1 Tax=Croceivirga sp. JEA036 TaxID=2721162 RepID=UPI00143A3C6A|nr:RagB/SusD family nutrient uptake outer membrane protein [Croceivirga sp. JEA036]NJB35164.1 RagB/SusD family nutrient uptake outer membrane protein [Croceivirga sp. JEA036]
MKSNKITLVFLATFLLILGSCEDSLEIDAADSFTEEFVYSDINQVTSLVLTNYNSTESWGLNKTIWWSRRYNIENASFESKFNFRDLDRLALRRGWNPANVGDFNNKWRIYYSYIREINLFFDKIDDSQAAMDAPEEAEILKAEMRFLRANLYFKLTRLYGAVPLIKETVGFDAETFDIPRNTYEECVEYIVAELDAAAAVLPETRPATEFGRATKVAAMAVKSRALLYAASELHDPSTAPSGPLYDYTKTTKWEDAAKAAKDIIDLLGNRDLIAVANAEEYRDLFLEAHEDIIWARPYGSDLYDFGTDVNSLWNQTQAPSGYGGWALSSPTLNYVLQYNMADGTSTQEGGYDPMNPNTDREMRYYANLNYNGATFRDREVEYFLSEDVNVFPHGLDSPEGLGNTLHSSKTGYNIRKFQDESVGLTETSPGRPFILYRLAEVFLNYAEASYHTGDEAAALEYLNKVSTRALQPTISASGEELLEAIKRERRVELAFEGHNFYDERRWMNSENLGFDIKGLRWTKMTDGNVVPEEYTVITRPWFDRQYYLPIPLSEIEKAPSLEQNAGY